MVCKEIRAKARQNLKDSWALAIGVAAVAVLLGGIVDGVAFLPDWKEEIELPLLTVGRLTFSVQNGVIGILSLILGGTVQLGHARFLLNQHDGQEVRFSDLFSQFHRFGQGFAQKFLCSLYTLLWSLCLVIPGIMAAYSYAMTPLLMADFPELGASEAISLSKKIMDGYKWELFVLDLTFLGWAILSAITANLGFLVLNPYTSAARAVFYRKLQSPLGSPSGRAVTAGD